MSSIYSLTDNEECCAIKKTKNKTTFAQYAVKVVIIHKVKNLESFYTLPLSEVLSFMDHQII